MNPLVTVYPIAKETRANCSTLELFLNRFVEWRTKQQITEPMKWPTDKKINELGDACYDCFRLLSTPYHMGDIRIDDTDKVSVDVEECEVAPIKVLVLIILHFALPVGADGDDEDAEMKAAAELAAAAEAAVAVDAEAAAELAAADVVFNEPDYFTEEALNVQWSYVHEIMTALLPPLVSVPTRWAVVAAIGARPVTGLTRSATNSFVI